MYLWRRDLIVVKIVIIVDGELLQLPKLQAAASHTLQIVIVK
jgi:hypothetical protein